MTYRQKIVWSEIGYLFLLNVVIPLSVGLQIFDKFSHTIGLIVVNVLQIPTLMLFYRWLLPRTLFRKKYGRFFLLLPLYLIIYELNSRLGSIVTIHLPFIAQSYRDNLASASPESFFSNFIIQNIGYTILVLLTASAFALFKQLYLQQRRVYELEAEKLRLELNQLKSQVQPHFFFNTLNNLYSLSLQGSPKTSVTIANLSGIMRYVLYESTIEKVLLSKEIAFMHSYIELERLRHNEPETIQFTVQGNPDSLLIEPLLFLPLIENCFKHSLQQSIQPTPIFISMLIDEREITFETRNKKAVASSSVQLNQGGIGLKNVKQRLALLYPNSHQLLIDEDTENFNVTLSIELH